MMKTRFKAIAALAVVGTISTLSLGFHANARNDNDDDSSSGNSPNRLLRGAYHFSQMNTCVTTRVGELPPTFDPETLQLVGPAETISFQSAGVTRFDGKGSVMIRGSAMAIFGDRLDPGDSPIGLPLDFTCDGTYTVTPNSLFELVAHCSGPIFDVGPLRIGGAISTDRETLIFSDNAPGIERLTIDGNVIGERICIAIATDIRRARRDD